MVIIIKKYLNHFDLEKDIFSKHFNMQKKNFTL